jgi:hypothetical protein
MSSSAGPSTLAAQAAHLRAAFSQAHERARSDSISTFSSTESDSSYDSDEEEAMIKEEWEESMRQMQMLVSIVLMPFFGKWMGRRWSYWGEFCDSESGSLRVCRGEIIDGRVLQCIYSI